MFRFCDSMDGPDGAPAAPRRPVPAREAGTDYRLRALECLQRAADATDRYERQTLLALADGFNRLAEHVGRRPHGD